jgi:hypothetical protein
VKTNISRSNRMAVRLASVVSLGFVSPAFAAMSMSLPTEQWSTYLLFGSIGLLVCGVVIKMLTYGAKTPGEPVAPAQPDDSFTIGAYRNRTLSPGP